MNRWNLYKSQRIWLSKLLDNKKVVAFNKIGNKAFINFIRLSHTYTLSAYLVCCLFPGLKNQWTNIEWMSVWENEKRFLSAHKKSRYVKCYQREQSQATYRRYYDAIMRHRMWACWANKAIKNQTDQLGDSPWEQSKAASGRRRQRCWSRCWGLWCIFIDKFSEYSRHSRRFNLFSTKCLLSKKKLIKHARVHFM